ncbi:MAG: M23 family metallopeptidase [Bacteroidales bacterium]|nr:M23 family metallopeptidase [Bacteroidales bacterium]
MSDNNYTFDPDSLSFEKADPKKGRKFLISLVTQLIGAFVIGLVVFLTISYTIKSPKQKKIERENEIMKQEYTQLSEKYAQADKVMEDIKQRDKDLYRAIFETEPIEEDLSNRYDKYAGNVSNKVLSEMMLTSADSSAIMLKLEETVFNELKYKLMNSKEKLQEIPSILPISDPEVSIIYYGFGQKLDPIYKTPQFHKGLDIAATIGTEVYATADGVVEFRGEGRVHGKHIIINHKNGYKTTYAHLSEYTVKNGSKVKRGEIIGFVGNTGKSLTPHLHYEINFKGQPINPVHYFFETLGPNQYSKLKTIANSIGLSLD